MKKTCFFAVVALCTMVGTAFSAVTWTTGAPGGSSPGGGLDFGGGSGPGTFVDVSGLDIPTNIQNSDYTMSLWLSADLIPNEMFFLGQTNQGIHHGLRDGGKLHSAHWGSDFSANTTVPTGPADDPNSWVHATFTHSAATGASNIYFNGVADRDEFTQNQPNGSGNLIIGSRNGIGGPAWDGQLDDVAVWNSILPVADIAAMAGGASPLSLSAAPLGYWDFEEGNGLLAADRSGNGFDGKLLPPPPPGEEAQPLVPGNWAARLIGIEGGTDNQINDHTEARQIIDFANGGPNVNDWAISEDVMDMRNRIDMAGGGGNFPSNHPYPDGTTAPNGDGNDFLVQATTKVPFKLPPGDYTIGFGSDDGGQLQMTGVSFLNEINTNGDADPNDDTIFFNGNRGHGWTLGEFTVGPEGLETMIDASFHERGGGDSFEIAIAEGHQGQFTGNGFFKTLAGEGEFGITVVPEPSSALLLLLGLVGLVGRRKRN